MVSAAAHRRKEHRRGPEAAGEAVSATEVGLAVAVLDQMVEGLKMGQRMAATEDDRTMTDLRSTFQEATARVAVGAAATLSP